MADNHTALGFIAAEILAQYAVVGPPNASNEVSMPDGAGYAVFGVTQQAAAAAGRHVSVRTSGESYAIVGGTAITAGQRVKCEGADGKIAPAVPSAVIDPTGANNALVYTAQPAWHGAKGNGISITYTVSGNSTALSVAVNGLAINVIVATNSAGVAVSTAAQVKAAIEANAEAAALVTVANSGSDTGAGAVAAVAQTFLEGGNGDFATALESRATEDNIIKIWIGE